MGAWRLPRLLGSASIAIGLCWAGSAGAQERVDFTRWEAGLGVGYQAPDVLLYGDGLSVSGLDLLVPFRLGHLRLEPSVGFSTHKSESSNLQTSSTKLDGGIGVFYGWALDSRTSAYVGTRLGLSHSWDKQSGSPSIAMHTQQTGWFVAPGGGAEAYLTPSLSLGAEFAVAYSRYSSNPQAYGALASLSGSKGWTLATRASVIFRVYFWRLGGGSTEHESTPPPVPAAPNPG